MSGYCTEAQVHLCVNTDEATSWADDAGDGTADTGVIQDAIDRASRLIWSIISVQYADTTDMDPDTYTAATYPVLDSMTAPLAVEFLRARQGRKQIDKDHTTLVWARQVAQGLAVIE